MNHAIYVSLKAGRIDGIECRCGEKFVAATAMHAATDHLLQNISVGSYRETVSAPGSGMFSSNRVQPKLPIYVDRRSEATQDRRGRRSSEA